MIDILKEFGDFNIVYFSFFVVLFIVCILGNLSSETLVVDNYKLQDSRFEKKNTLSMKYRGHRYARHKMKKD